MTRIEDSLSLDYYTLLATFSPELEDSIPPLFPEAYAMNGTPGDDEITLIINDVTSNNIVDGGAGTDLLILDLTALTENIEAGYLSSGTDTFYARVSEDSLMSSFVMASDFENIRILAGAGDNQLGGGDGNDEFHLFNVGGVNDIDGGNGVDQLNLITVSENVTIDLSLGSFDVLNAGNGTVANIENVYSGSGNDIMIGDGHDNLLAGGDGDDLIQGGAGNDFLSPGRGSDIVFAGDGDDRISAFAGPNILNGEAGNDRIVSGVDADTVDGGTGNDTLEYLRSAVGVDVNLATGEALGGDAEGDVFSNIENLVGSDYDDILTGDSNDNSLSSGAGNDVLYSNGGHDILSGGAGDDIIVANEFTIGTVDGGSGFDILRMDSDQFFSPSFMPFMPAPELQNVSTSSGVITTTDIERFEVVNPTSQLITQLHVFGGLEGDLFDFSADNFSPVATIRANTGHGDDTVITGHDNLTIIYSGDGNDTLILGGGDNRVTAGNGDDVIVMTETSIGIADGGNGFDTLRLMSDQILSPGFQSFSPAPELQDISTISGVIDTTSIERFEAVNPITELIIQLYVFGGLDDDTFDFSQDSFSSSAIIRAYTGHGDDIVITGQDNRAYIESGDGDDILVTGGGDDRFTGGAGADHITGGLGFDTAYYIHTNAAVNINLQTNVNTGGVAEGDQLFGIESVVGSQFFDDVLVGDDNDNTLRGHGGNDTLTGGGGSDRFHYVNYEGVFSDIITDMDFNDILSLESSVFDGAFMTPIFIGRSAFSNVAGQLRYEAANGQTSLQLDIDGDGVADESLILANGEFDLISTNFNNAPLELMLSFNVITGTIFNDTLFGTENDDFITGLEGNDTLWGNEGNDTLHGNEGADVLIGGVGADVMDGGAGFDSVDYRSAAAGVSLNIETGGITGDATGDTFFNIERLYGSNFNDVITGSSANEFLYGEDGNDTINGGGGIDRIYGGSGDDIQRGDDGNDVLYGSVGADQLNGGTGYDIANYAAATGGIIANMASGGTGGDAAGDTYFGLEAVFGSAFNDTIIGNAGTNEIRGENGDDSLDGEAGNDRLFGGAGADIINGGAGTDTAYYTAATAGVALNLSSGGTQGEANGDSFISIEWVRGSNYNDDITGDEMANSLFGNGGDDALSGAAGNDSLFGGDGNDTINGGEGVDSIFGQDGDDILSGGAGNDFFFGGAGADSHDGGTGTDTVSYLPSLSGVTVNLQTGGSGGDATGDSYINIERVFGTSHDDSITGSNDNDVLFGNGGADFLTGGLGNDSLIGGAGIDSFGYNTTSDGADIINDFFTGETIFILGGDPDFDTFSELQTIAADAGANVIFDFGGGNTLTVVGRNIADLDASDFNFSNIPLALTLESSDEAFDFEDEDIELGTFMNALIMDVDVLI